MYFLLVCFLLCFRLFGYVCLDTFIVAFQASGYPSFNKKSYPKNPILHIDQYTTVPTCRFFFGVIIFITLSPHSEMHQSQTCHS